MNKLFYSLLLSFSLLTALAQTSNENLNSQLQEMRKFFLAEDYANFINYTYPRLAEMAGGKENLIKLTKQSMEQLKNDGFKVVEIGFKDASDFYTKDNELQCTLRQVLIMDTPKGMIESEYTMIAISEDDGLNWTFLDTSGKEKATMLKYFPNLHEDIDIRPKEQKYLD